MTMKRSTSTLDNLQQSISAIKNQTDLSLENRSLKVELEQAQKQLEEFSTRVDSQNEDGVLIDIDSIRPSQQARQTFTEKSIIKKKLTLLDSGQLSNLEIVRLEKPEGEIQYEIEDGERTWRAARQLVKDGYESFQFLKANIKKRNTSTHRNSLIHHEIAERLNNLDRVEALYKELLETVNLMADLDEKLLNKANYNKSLAVKLRFQQIIGKLKNKINRDISFKMLHEELILIPGNEREAKLREVNLTDTEREVLLFLYEWQIENLDGFYRNQIPTMFLDSQLKKAIRKQGLSCSNALLLSKIEEPKIKNNLTKKTIQNNWSKKELKQAIKNHYSQKQTSTTHFSPQKVQQVLSGLNKKSLESTTREEKEQLINFLEAKIKLLKET